MSSTQHQLIEQCATRLRGIVEALDNIHDSTPHRWSTDLDEVHSSAESLLAMIKDQAPARSETSFEEWLANELEGEDGQPVPAAVCDITLARRAFNHWPKLEQPAKVGGVRFSAGVSSRLVVEAAQRLYEFESTPEKEAERIERLQAFREQLDPLNLAPHAEAFNEAPDEALRPEQAEAERPALWAVHAQGPDELYAGFSREDAEKHAAELNALPMPEGIAVGAVVVPSPWPEAEHWKYLAEQERDHKNEIAGRLRQFERICEGLPQGAIDGGWTVHGIRGYAKRLEDQLKAALARVAELERQEPEGVRILLARAQGQIEHLAECTENLGEDLDDDDVSEDVAEAREVAEEIAALLAAAPGKEVPQAWLDVQAERRRQVETEGWTPEHDDEHSHGQMARAAACYALAGSSAPNDGTAALLVSLAWPWDQQWWKPTSARRDLVKACALALAEIERLDRACISQSPQPGATTASS
ncbi:hypothetical protein N0581_25870 [Pseudomonas aeruginosa]|nr:hypothetical protein [Pseudomonas aeruginosa]MCT0159876.1 hypothetical protein [Pseudomonas aeruginosa]MCT0173642.1 hypothetical protein [Pseudomonas aeruginosa]MCT0179537.1 hypothetical protein [Pseudomonas aeruginosa]MCT0190012.1 hypothetical protein [Pseudomonas aeruginosa]